MTLTAKGLATRDRIVRGAADVMREFGVADTTLDDVRARTGTSKSQLFHYFPDGREELLLAVAQHEADRVLDDQEPHLGRLESWSTWDAWRDAVVERYRAQGTSCPLHALMSQVGPATPGAQAVVLELMRSWQAPLESGVARMQAAGQMRTDLSAETAAQALIAAIQGGVQVLLATGTTSHLEAGLDLTLAHLREA